MRSLGARRARVLVVVAVAALALSSCGRQDITDIVGDHAPVAKTYVGLQDVEQVQVWLKNACARHTDGSITCWGAAESSISKPPKGAFTDMALGGESCAIKKEDRRLRCWGAAVESNEELQAVLDDEFLAVESAGGDQCGLRVDRSIACWGVDRAPAGKFTQIAAGAQDFCALRIDRTVACWGPVTDGRLSIDEDAMDSASDQQYEDIVSAGYYVCGIQDGHVEACWGIGPREPIIEPLLDSTATVFSGTSFRFCAIADNQGIVCWNRDGDAVAGPSRGKYLSFDSTNEFQCAVTARRQAACWGDNKYGRADPSGAVSP